MTKSLHDVLKHRKRNYHTVSVDGRDDSGDKGVMKFRLLQLRKDRGLTQSQVAEHLGISQSLYAGLEGGRRRLNETYMDGLASLYGISPGELYAGEDNVSPEFQRLERAFSQLSEAEKKIAVAQVEAILALHRKD